MLVKVASVFVLIPKRGSSRDCDVEDQPGFVKTISIAGMRFSRLHRESELLLLLDVSHPLQNDGSVRALLFLAMNH